METEMRTPPLWGLRFRDPMLHDGRAAGGTFEERTAMAISEHAGQGSASRDAFNALSVGDQASLMAFLDSLGRAEFDSDGDNFISNDDFADFSACFTGPGSFYTPDDACSVHDFDQDGDVDADDYAVFVTAMDETPIDCNLNGMADMDEIMLQGAADCNRNGMLDSCEITADPALDANGNSVLDSCESFLRGDCNHDGANDLADVIYGLGNLFTGDPLLCADSCDNNNDGHLDIADPIFLVQYLFSSGPDLAEPFTACGTENDNDGLSCSNPLCP